MMTNRFRRLSGRSLLACGLLLTFSLCFANTQTELKISPLEPVDTSSPRATLQGFIDTMDTRYDLTLGENGAITQYLTSRRFFPEPGFMPRLIRSMNLFRARATNYLDLTDLPEATQTESAWRLVIQLKEILDRLNIPPYAEVPDNAQMDAAKKLKWAIPKTDIRIVKIQTGAREGEYLFSRETVAKLPDFYEAVKNEPYKPRGTLGWYEFAFHTPSGVAMALGDIIPPRWFFEMPEWTRTLVLDQPIWRWVGIFLTLAVMLAVYRLANRLRRLARESNRLAAIWVKLLPATSLMITIPPALWFMGEVLRVSPMIFSGLNLFLWGVFYLARTWLIWSVGGVLAEWLIGVERLHTSSIDSQLIRLVLRLASGLVAVAVLVEGANRLGLPAYSVIAGLGIGGLAVALAGQQTLANLFGSLIIMFEKPFRVGHSIKTPSVEGVVEDVSFRSTRIRTSDNTLVSVPSSELANHKIENLSVRKVWRVRKHLHLSIDTPAERLQQFISGVEALLNDHPNTRKDKIHVLLTNIESTGFDILVDYSLNAASNTAHKEYIHEIFMNIVTLAEGLSVRFQTE